MSQRPEPESIPLSFLNAIEYCPRRFYYEFVQGEMLVNEFVLEGTLLHQRADEPGLHKEEGMVQINRLYLHSETLRLAGFADIVEEQEDGLLVPVEYKHGKEGKWLNDHVQLCAQALCLEERQPDKPPISYGYVFYFGSRKRVQVHFTQQLRTKTRAVIDQAFQLSLQNTPPPPLEGKLTTRCRDCSLYSMCLPTEVKLLKSQRKDRSSAELPSLEETPPTLTTGDTGIHGTQLETLLGLEGAGSAIYFSCFHNLLADQQQWTFSGRVKRPPTDPVNALLSYGYAILSSQVSSAVQIVGFDPYVGYLHSSAYGRPALALDLMEEFRPLIVDSVVTTLLNNRMLTLNDFHVELGAYRLKKEPKKVFLTRFEERLNEEVTHPIFGYKTKYRQCIELQARLMAKHITGELDEYPPFIMR